MCKNTHVFRGLFSSTKPLGVDVYVLRLFGFASAFFLIFLTGSVQGQCPTGVSAPSWMDLVTVNNTTATGNLLSNITGAPLNATITSGNGTLESGCFGGTNPNGFPSWNTAFGSSFDHNPDPSIPSQDIVIINSADQNTFMFSGPVINPFLIIWSLGGSGTTWTSTDLQGNPVNVNITAPTAGGSSTSGNTITGNEFPSLHKRNFMDKCRHDRLPHPTDTSFGTLNKESLFQTAYYPA